MFTKADAEAYFNGEKQESLLFMCIGAAALIAAFILFFYIKQSWSKGVALPMALIAILQLMVGYTVFSKSDRQRSDIVYKMDLDPDALKNMELPRMEAVMKNFTIYRYSEIFLVIAGLLLFVIFRSHADKQFWVGVGAGLALQASIMLLADGFAERRGTAYKEGLTEFLKTKTR